MSSVTAAPITGYTARLTVSIDAGTVGTMTIERIVNGGARRRIIAGVGIPAASGVFDDPEVPLGVPVIWEVRLSNGTVLRSEPVTILSTLPVLSDPYRGRSVQVWIVSMDSRGHHSRTTAVDVEGRPDPVPLWDVESSARWPAIELLTTTLVDRNTLDDMCSTGDPLLLRSTCVEPGDHWLQRIGDRTVDRFTPTSRTETRLHKWSDVASLSGSPRPSEKPAGDTLGDLNRAVGSTTLGAIAERWPTLLAIASEDLRSL